MALNDPENLLSQLDSEDVDVKKAAIFNIGRQEITKAIPKLIDLLEKDEDSVVRNSAARTLGKLTDLNYIDQVLPALIKALNDPDYRVQTNACWSLGKLNDPRAIPALQKMVDPSKKIYTKTGDGKSLEGSEESQASEKLKEEGVKYSDTILEAVKALGSFNDPRAIPALKIALNDEADGTVRCKAALSMGKIKSPEAISPLIERLKEEKYWYVRRDLIKALMKLKAVEAIPELVKKTNDMYKDVRDVALDALLKLGKAARDEILKLLFSDPSNPKIQNFVKKNFTASEMKASLQKLKEKSDSKEEKAKFEHFLQKFQ